jgi:alpha-galactosidase
MIANGMRDLGYNYIELDDCWASTERDAQGRLMADSSRFPSGSLKPLADYLHQNGFKLGAYTCAGNLTCRMNRQGSWGHFDSDAQTFASWGVDMVKMDWCYHPALPPKNVYQMFRDSLNKTGAPILFSVCEWGEQEPWTWGMETANIWRATGDHIPFFWLPEGHKIGWSTVEIIENFKGLSKYSGPGGWNDADFLMTGMFTMSDMQSQVEFSFWALFNSPLIVATDVRDMTRRQQLLNKEVIAINQDSLARSGDILYEDGNGGEIWSKPLYGGDTALIFYNKKFGSVAALNVTWTQLGYPSNIKGLYVRDLWMHNTIGLFQKGWSAIVLGWEATMVRVSMNPFQ